MKKILLITCSLYLHSNIQALTMPIEYINIPTTNLNLGKYFLYSSLWTAFAAGLIFANVKLAEVLNKKFEEKYNKEVPLTELFDAMKKRNNDKNLLDSIIYAINFTSWPVVVYLFSESWKNFRIYARIMMAQGLKQNSIPVITGSLPWYTKI